MAIDAGGAATEIKIKLLADISDFNSKMSSAGAATKDISKGDMSKLQKEMNDSSSSAGKLTKELKSVDKELKDIQKDAKIEMKMDSKQLKKEMMGNRKKLMQVNKLSKAFGGEKIGGIGQATALLGAGGAFSGELAMLAPVIAAISAAFIPIVIAVGAIVALFAILITTSGTFRSMIGGLVAGFQQIFGWVQNVAGALMSGDFGKAGQLIKDGFTGAFDVIKNFDYGSVPANLIKSFTESFNVIRDTILNIASWFSQIDWGGVWDTLVSSLGSAFDTIQSTFGNAFVQLLGPLYDLSFALGDTFNYLLSIFGEFAARIKEAFGFLAKGDIGGFINKISEAFATLWKDIMQLDWGGIFSEVATDLREKLTEAFNSVVSQLGTIFAPVGKILSSVFDTLKSIDWGGMFAGALDAVAGILDTLMNIDPSPIIDMIVNAIGGLFDTIMAIDWGAMLQGLVDAITGLFGGGGGGGGKADIGAQMSTSVEKAGPDILGKLGNVFVKLVSLLPTVFMKATTALAAALGAVDWGAVAGKMWASFTTTLAGLVTFLGGLPWLEWATTVWNALIGILGTVVTWLINLPWLDWATAVWNALIGLLGTIVTWLIALPWGTWALAVWNFMISGAALGQIVWWLISLPWAQWAGSLWNALVTAIGGMVTWLKGLPWGQWAGELWEKLKAAVIGFGAWLLEKSLAFFVGLPGKIQSALIGFGQWLIDAAASFFTAIGDRIRTALGLKSDLATANEDATALIATLRNSRVEKDKDGRITGIYVPNASGSENKIAAYQHGGIFEAIAGGQLIRVGEGHEREVLIPWHRVGEDWGTLIPSLGKTNSSNSIVGGGVSSLGGSKSSSSQASSTINYNTYITVDSENLKRKVFEANREHEQYNQLRG